MRLRARLINRSDAARAEWRYTSSVKQASYSLQTSRGQQAQMLAGERQLQLING